MNNILITALLTILGAAAAMQVIIATVPAGNPRTVLMIAISAAAGIFLLNRVAYASSVNLETQTLQMQPSQTAPALRLRRPKSAHPVGHLSLSGEHRPALL